MIYNLLQFFKDNKPDYSYCVNGYHNTSPIDVIAINETSSIPAKWIDRADLTLQIVSRNCSTVKAKEALDDVFTIVDRRYGVILPETTQDGVVFPEVKTFQMTPLQRPIWLDYDENGNGQYVFNLQIVIK